MKEWLRTYGALVAVTVSVLSWLGQCGNAESIDRNELALRQQAEDNCDAITDVIVESDDRLVHLKNMSSKLTGFLDSASDVRYQTAIVEREALEVEQARLNEEIAVLWRKWADELRATEEFLNTNKSLTCRELDGQAVANDD